jgi:hypothetical protein
MPPFDLIEQTLLAAESERCLSRIRPQLSISTLQPRVPARSQAKTEVRLRASGRIRPQAGFRLAPTSAVHAVLQPAPKRTSSSPGECCRIVNTGRNRRSLTEACRDRLLGVERISEAAPSGRARQKLSDTSSAGQAGHIRAERAFPPAASRTGQGRMPSHPPRSGYSKSVLARPLS